MSDVLIRGGRVLIPSRSFDGRADLLVRGGKVERIAPSIKAAKGADVTIIDADGLWVAPGLVDPHVHLREPGFEYKETIATGTRAAAAGGFTTVLAMANTDPVNDNAAVTRFILRKAEEVGVVRVRPVGAVTRGQAGEALSEMVDMSGAGCAAFSDDGKPVMNAFLVRKALEYLGYVGRTYITHAEDLNLAAGGCCHEGAVSLTLGLRGIPSAAEEVMVARDVILARETGGRLHVAHASTKGTADIVREAKRQGAPVTAEVTPHHLFLTDEAIATFDPDTKVNPPLRPESDRRAMVEALADGTIDCIASDHAPHGLVDKEVEYDRAAFGISGLETSLGLCLGLVREGIIEPLRLIELMSAAPARVMGIEAGDLAEGLAADIVLIDPELAWTVDPASFFSRGKNTPFRGRALTGRAVVTLVGGRAVHLDDSAAGRVTGSRREG
jgi:dihydroorotase